MKKLQNQLTKWLIEGLLIITSILLAFYLENLKEESVQRNRLILALEELKESIATDTLVFYNVATKALPNIDEIYMKLLDSLDYESSPKMVVHYLEQTDLGPIYHNWILERLLKGDELVEIDLETKQWLWDYLTTFEFYQLGVRHKLLENENEIERLAYSELTTEGYCSELSVKKIRNLLWYNQHLLGKLKSDLLGHSEFAIKVIDKVDKKIIYFE